MTQSGHEQFQDSSTNRFTVHWSHPDSWWQLPENAHHLAAIKEIQRKRLTIVNAGGIADLSR